MLILDKIAIFRAAGNNGPTRAIHGALDTSQAIRWRQFVEQPDSETMGVKIAAAIHITGFGVR